MDEMGCTAVRGHRSPAVVLFLRKMIIVVIKYHCDSSKINLA